ncbi:MAG: hypothetical protein HFJ45_02430 [Clostridia bacterium]|nr:hypothetical protein [Clostridia bacterium]
MKSLKLLEEINKILIDANKRCDIAFKNVGECDKVRGDLEHDLLNKYKDMKAKEKRKFTDELFESLVERHNQKYEFRELEILKELYNTPLKLETAINTAINKLRKLNQEQETPIYYKRASRNKGEKIIVKEIN